MPATSMGRAILLLLGLAGCAGTPVFNVHYDASYWPGETAAAGGEIIVLVRGNPSALPKPVFDRVVTDAMQGWSAYPIHFTTEGNPYAAYRIVMVFNPPPTAGGPTLCYRPDIVDGLPGYPGAARVPVIAALCRGDYYVSLADGSIAAPNPFDDDFRYGIGLMTASLIPAQNPQRLGNESCHFC